jgi:SAM-dependent methyltransferase
MTDDLTDRIRDSYEEIPYESGPHYAAHPDCLATVARLRGLEAPELEGCRVLELGCGTGGHLLPIAAALPAAEVVGVDLAPGHVEAARRVVGALGLGNARFLAADLRALPGDLGLFDYIVCHGVYSWVPEDVRRALLEAVGRHLAPGGLAMISFNALPGSRERDTLRGLVRFARERVLAPGDPVEDLRSLLGILPAALEGVESPSVDGIRRSARDLGDEPRYYLAHEYLAPVNQAFWSWEVARDAEGVGLRWVDDAWDHDDGETLPESARTLLDRLSPTALDRRQWLDLVRDAAFRRAIFCRAEQAPEEEMDAARIPDLWASAGAWPVSEDRQAAGGGGGEASAFASRTHRVSTNVPVVEIALRRLHDAWPESIPVRTLWEEAREEARASGAPAAAPDDLGFLSGALLRCYRHQVVSLHVRPFPVSTEPGARPRAGRLARYQAERGPEVTNLVHQRVRLEPVERAVLSLLDGTRDVAALVGALAAASPGDEAPDAERVRGSLEILARGGLLLRPGAEQR